MRLLHLLAAPMLVLAAVPSTAQQLPAAVASASPHLKSTTRAQLLALGHTLAATGAGAALMSQDLESQWKGDVGYWLFTYGALFAPSIGNFYTGDTRRATLGVGIRGVGSTLVIASMVAHLFSPESDIDNPDGGGLQWDALNLSGGAIILTGAAYSILSAPRSVAEYNERATGGLRVRAAPALDTRTGAVGVQVKMRF